MNDQHEAVTNHYWKDNGMQSTTWGVPFRDKIVIVFEGIGADPHPGRQGYHSIEFTEENKVERSDVPHTSSAWLRAQVSFPRTRPTV